MLQKYLEFFGLASSMGALAFGAGVALALLIWLKFKGRKGCGSRVFLSFAAACLLPIASAFCLRVEFASWWDGACIVLGVLAGLLLWIGVANDPKGNSGSGFWVGAITFCVIRFPLGWLGPIILFPVFQYVVGYAVAVVMPPALLFLFGAALLQLHRARLAPVWPLVAFSYFVCGTAAVFLGPLMGEGPRRLAEDTLVAILPSVAVLVLFGVRRSRSIRMIGVLALYLVVAALLYRSTALPPGSSASPLVQALLTLPVSLGFCAILLCVVAVSAYRAYRSASELGAEIPLWVAIMPWLTLVPAFYFGGRGVDWFLGFVISNSAVGLALAAVFLFPPGTFEAPAGAAAGRGTGPRQVGASDWRVPRRRLGLVFPGEAPLPRRSPIDQRARIRSDWGRR